MGRTNRRSRGLAFMLGLFILLPALFQGFFRYQNFTVGTTVWRIDRLTQQACKINVRPIVCSPPAPLLQWPEAAPATESHKWYGSSFNYA